MVVRRLSAVVGLVVLAAASCGSVAHPAASPSTTATDATTTVAAPSITSLAATGVVPDPAFTPGAINPLVSPATIDRTICVAGWTATVRPPESYTEQVKRLEDGGGGTVSDHGVTYPVHGFELADADLSHFELDHLIPLEIGGAPADPRNLWLEPYESPKGSAAPGTGSQTKDEVENAAKGAVCAGRISLADAQRQMASNWAVLGQQLGVAGIR